jgi:bla regulator protein blaR1
MTAIGQSNLLQALGWAVFNSLWQMAILWVAYQFIISVFRINKSSHRGSLSAILLFAGFAWFIFTFISVFSDRASAGDSYAGLMKIGAYSELNQWLNTMMPIASIFYLLLLVLPVLNFIRNYRYVQVIRHNGLTRADVHWRMFVQKIAAQMGIRKPVHIWMSDLVSSPVTIGYIKPVILLPLAAVNHLSTQQIEAVLLHELSHIRRYDYFINLITKFIQAILYFNPFVKGFATIIEREREKSCDETVIQFQYEPHGYASALLALEKAAHTSPRILTVAAAQGKKSEFRKRIEWILGIRQKPAFSFTKLAGVIAGLLCFITLNAFLIMSNPEKPKASHSSTAYLPMQYDLLMGGGYDKTTNAVIKEHKSSRIANADPARDNEAPEMNEAIETSGQQDTDATEIASPFSYVFDLENVIPKLDADKEKQVQEVLIESKKVIQEKQWKDIEKSIADALTMIEKEKVKEQYEKALSQIDWDKLGDKLRIAYDHIDWNQINAQLNTALTEIKIDSLKQVYTVAIDNLSCLQKELVKNNQCAVPDTDITIQSIERKKNEMQKAINKLKKVTTRKIVHL